MVRSPLFSGELSMTETQGDPLIGTVVSGRYRVLRMLGEGGMGRVYLAEHEAIEKKVALKVLHIEYSRKADIVTRFQQEAISASRIKHPNVLDVFDFGQLEDGSFFLAMEFLEGNDLADELVRTRVLRPERGLRLAVQICRALGAAHAKGVVHRDMKPENVFLQRTGDGEEIVKIVDFGIAQLRTNDEMAASEPKRRRLTKTGMIFGTPEYMAPEQAGGRRADHRADVYAVGVILYEMFTGAVPFTGDSFVAVLTRTLQDPPPPMNEVAPDIAISGALQVAILRALAKTPEERYASMGEFAQALLATPEGTATKATLAGLDIFAGQSQVPETLPEFVAPPHHPPVPAPSPDRATGGTLLTNPGAASAKTLGSRRANTQLVAAHTATPQISGSLGLVGGALGLLVLVAGGAAVWWALRDAATTASPELASAAPPLVPTPSVAPPPSATAAPSAEVSAITTVTIRVETDPSGALVLKDGFQVCDDTPCSVTAAPNETLELEATKGRLRGKQKVLAQRDQTVQIALAAPVVRPKPAQHRLCEVEVDGLKILRPCN